MNLEKKLQIFLIVLLISAQFGIVRILPSAEAFDLTTPSNYPVVYVYPNFTDVNVGQNFTIAVVGFNFTNVKIQNPDNPLLDVWLGNLYGFDIEFTWDPAIIKYVTHTVTCPVQDYPAPNPPSPYGGVLNKETLEIANVIDEDGNIPDAQDPRTRAKFAYASMYPAAGQNGNVTFFTMTFTVLNAGESALEILACDVAAADGTPIYRKVYNGVYRTVGVPEADFTYWPDAPVVNNTVEFTATVKDNTTNIATYMWDFGDGNKQDTTVPITTHIYTSKGEKIAALKVVDEVGLESAWVNKTFTVAAFRDLEVFDVYIPTTRMKVNASIPFEFNVTIRNLGESNENCTVYAYYNTTVVDPANPSAASWHLINQTNLNISKAGAGGPTPKTLEFKINTTTLTLNASYYIFANITGIPVGYERNIDDNYKLSETTVFFTNVDIHEVIIVNLECLWQSGRLEEKPPLIEGEETTVRLTVKNNGTGPDTLNIEAFLNGISVQNSTVSIAWGETKVAVALKKQIEAGKHNISVTVKAGDFTVSGNTSVRIVKPPLVQFSYTPSSPIVNQTVTFNASATVHQDPEGTITLYSWEIFAPGVDWTTASPTKKLDGTVVTYNFTRPGNWTVVLRVKDSFGLEYQTRRPGSNVYSKDLRVNIAENVVPPVEEGGIPIEYIIAVVLVIVIGVVAVVYIVIKRRKTLAEKPPEET